MNNFISSLFSILINPPGNLVYYLLLIISIVGSLQGTIAVQRSGASPFARRTISGLVVLLIVQVLPFLITPFAWSRLSEAQTILSPLDRAISLLSLIWIAWIWIFPRPAPKADAATVIFSILTLLLLGISLIVWPQQLNENGFNHTFQDNLWQILTLGFILLATLVLLFRRPPGFGYGLATLILAGIGHLVHFLFPFTTGYFSGVIRFTQIAMYPLLLTLPQFISEHPPAAAAARVLLDEDNQTFQERRRFSTDPKTFNSLFTLAAEAETDRVGPNITRAIAQSMMADLVFLILIDSDKNLNIACGYDLIREEVLDGAVIDKETIPLLSNAILRGRPLRLTTGNTTDIQGLSQIVGLSNPGNVMSVPFETTKKGSAIGAILLLSPYSNRVWSKDDQSYLSNVSGSIVPIMARSQQLAGSAREREAYLSQIAELQQKLKSQETDTQVNQELSGKNDLMVKNMAALSAALEEARKEISQFQEEKDLQVTSSDSSSSNPSELELQFRMTLEELAFLQNELGEANSKLMELEQQPENSASSSTTAIPVDQLEALATISQELRQPMSSLIGYIDLLLGESVGILGALQRKFLERVKASTERIGRLVDDLIQITSIESGRILINPEIIDLNLIIDNAVAYTSTQLREKNITMRLDIPEAPPKIHIDREALQQIMIHLLQNAGEATLVEGMVMLRVKFHEEEGKDFLMIQVVDSGGGIPAEDLPRVFARRYRADNVLIQGLGDTGVGLSIAKTLVEAQSGRIWVDTSKGVGSTFSALLPFESLQPEEED